MNKKNTKLAVKTLAVVFLGISLLGGSIKDFGVRESFAKTTAAKGKALTGWARSDILSLAVSPDGKYVSYAVSTGESSGAIYRKSIKSKSGASLLASGFYPNFLTYSPDGKYISYLNYSDLGKLYRKNADDGGVGEAINDTHSSYPSYSSSGEYIVYCANLTTVGGANRDVIYRKKSDDTNRGEQIASPTATNPVYSPSGNKIIYVNDDDGSKIYQKNADDKNDGEAINGISSLFISYSSNGKNILYRGGDYPNSNYGIYVKKATDKNNGKRILKTMKDGYPTKAVYTSNGKNIIYVFRNKKTGKERLYLRAL